MAAPTVGSLQGFGCKATVTSSAITGTISGKMRVTNIDYGKGWTNAELMDGEGTFVGAVAHGGKRTLTLTFVYTDDDFPDVPPYEVVTVASASQAQANGKWYHMGTQTLGASEAGFAKYGLVLEQKMADDCVTVALPSQS